MIRNGGIHYLFEHECIGPHTTDQNSHTLRFYGYEFPAPPLALPNVQHALWVLLMREFLVAHGLRSATATGAEGGKFVASRGG